jgi:hypothetical protein
MLSLAERQHHKLHMVWVHLVENRKEITISYKKSVLNLDGHIQSPVQRSAQNAYASRLGNEDHEGAKQMCRKYCRFCNNYIQHSSHAGHSQNQKELQLCTRYKPIHTFKVIATDTNKAAAHELHARDRASDENSP